MNASCAVRIETLLPGTGYGPTCILRSVTRRVLACPPPGEISSLAVSDTSEQNCHAALATSPDALDRAIAMNRQLSEAEASLARLIDAVIADEVTEPDFNAAPHTSLSRLRHLAEGPRLASSVNEQISSCGSTQ